MGLRLLTFLLLATHTLSATLTVTIGSSVSSTVKCSTRLASTSKKNVPTATSTRTNPPNNVIILSASTPITTIGGGTSTTTTTETSSTTVTSTASTITDVFSTTSTDTDTITNQVVVTSVVTEVSSTSSTTTSTSHIPAPDGFRGIEDSTGYTDYGARKRALIELSGQHSRRTSPKAGVGALVKLKYPAAVSCVEYVQTTYTEKIVAVRATSTVTGKASTSTVTTVETSTSTSTVVPDDVSTTLSFSTTETVTEESTRTDVSTTTSVNTILATSSTTVYDACAPTNILGPRLSNGKYIYSVNGYGNNAANTGLELPATSAYECCVACLNYEPPPGSPGGRCQFTNFYTNSNQCFAFAGTQCGNPGYYAGTLNEPMNYFSTLAFSNGPCGMLAARYPM